MKTHPKMMLLLQTTLSFSFLDNGEHLMHFETVVLRNTCIPRHSKFETLALLGRHKERNDEFCGQRRTRAHLAEGAAKDTVYVHATVLPARVTSSKHVV